MPDHTCAYRRVAPTIGRTIGARFVPVPSMPPFGLARWIARRAPRHQDAPLPAPAPGESVRFQCNLCGRENVVATSRIGREIASCAQCLSTVRLRTMAHLVTRELLGVDRALADLPQHRHIAGIGLSDDERVAPRLAKVFDYQNTFFDAEPRLDITAVPPERRARYDFVTSSDVFEHVLPPVQRAFAGARALLKRGGICVLTVPFTLEPDTQEHFPDLFEWHLERHDGAWQLHNVTRDGRTQTFRGLVFHEDLGDDGKPGTALEMRVFSRAALEREFLAAGFSRVRIAAEPCPRFGIAWPEPWSVPMVAYAD